MIMGSQILFGREDVEQYAVQQVAAGPRIVFDQDVFQLDDLHLDLVMMFPEDRYIVFRIFHAFQQSPYIREYRLFLIRHVFVHLCRIFIKEFSDDERHIFRAAGNRFRQLAADMGQPEVQEIGVCIMQISDQSLDRQAFVNVCHRRGDLFRQKVHDGQERAGIDTVLAAHLSDVLFSESECNTEAAHNKHHRIILADQIAHFIGLPIFTILIHRLFSLVLVFE